jgi:hypothetical protein
LRPAPAAASRPAIFSSSAISEARSAASSIAKKRLAQTQSLRRHRVAGGGRRLGTTGVLRFGHRRLKAKDVGTFAFGIIVVGHGGTSVMKKNSNESAEYIAAMSKQLAELARQNEFMDAALLLQMVHLEITQHCENTLRRAQGKN